MATKLIELEDGTLVEVDIQGEQIQQISGGIAEKVCSTFDSIRPLLVKTCRPIASAWEELNKEMNIEQAEVEIGVSFEGEGNLYVTKSKAGANLTITLTLKPKDKK